MWRYALHGQHTCPELALHLFGASFKLLVKGEGPNSFCRTRDMQQLAFGTCRRFRGPFMPPQGVWPPLSQTHEPVAVFISGRHQCCQHPRSHRNCRRHHRRTSVPCPCEEIAALTKPTRKNTTKQLGKSEVNIFFAIFFGVVGGGRIEVDGFQKLGALLGSPCNEDHSVL